MSKRTKRKEIKQWFAENTGKHFCHCGCGSVIEIKIHHHVRGIPQFINGHVSRVANPMKGKNGDHNPHFKGERYKNKKSYVMVGVPVERTKGFGYVAEHILVMEESIGRRLKKGENVHHKNGIKDDNRLENLELLSAADHCRIHAIDRARALLNRATIVIDSREKCPWEFDQSAMSTIHRALPTGDYSLCGLENAVAIERKEINDYVSTVIHNWPRFREELRRMASMDSACIIVECTVQDIIDKKYNADVAPLSLIGRAHGIFCDYGIPVQFAGPRPVARLFAERLLMMWHKKLGNQNQDERINDEDKNHA